VVKAGLAGLIWGTACWVVVMLFPARLMSLFGTESQFLAEGARAFRIFGFGLFAAGLQMVLSFFFQGIGGGIPSLVLVSSRNVIFRLPGLVILPRLFGLAGLWAAFPVADIMAAVLTLSWAGIQFRKLGIPFRLRSREGSGRGSSEPPRGGGSHQVDFGSAAK
jgi:Na+-driven multidrug efflux pump